LQQFTAYLQVKVGRYLLVFHVDYITGNSWAGIAATFYNSGDMSAPVFSEIGRKIMAISASEPTGLPREVRSDEVYEQRA
jgi:hypothetical protein